MNDISKLPQTNPYEEQSDILENQHSIGKIVVPIVLDELRYLFISDEAFDEFKSIMSESIGKAAIVIVPDDTDPDVENQYDTLKQAVQRRVYLTINKVERQ